MKQQYNLICLCGKHISGLSEKHAKKNLEIHKLFSREHYQRMRFIKNKHHKKIIVHGLSNDFITSLLATHPFIIEDMKEIGRVMKTKEERNAEKKIMVS
jgi:hypothetical protein